MPEPKYAILSDGTKKTFPADTPDEAIAAFVNRTQAVPGSQPAASPEAAQQRPVIIPQTPIPTGYQGFEAGSVTPSVNPQATQQLARSLAAGTIGYGGAAGGAALGGFGGPLAPVTVPLGEMAGSYGARALNKFLGLEDPSTFQDILAVGGPLVSRGVGAAAKYGPSLIPGAGGAMHEMAATTARALVEARRPLQSTDELYAVVRQYKMRMPALKLQETAKLIEGEQAQLFKGLENTQVQRIVDSIQEKIAEYGGNVPFDVLETNLKAIGAEIGAARASGGSAYGALKRLYHALLDDIDTAAERSSGVEGARVALMNARRTARREFALDELSDVIESGIKLRSTDGMVTVTPGTMINKLDRLMREDPVFVGSFDKGELDAMRSSLLRLTDVKRLPPEAGGQFGAGRGLMTAGGSYLAAQQLGLDPQWAGAVATVAPFLIAKAMMTPQGRTVMKGIMRAGGILTPAAMQELVAVTSAGRAGASATLSP